MKFLRFASTQYINTGINPGAGYRIATAMRMSQQSSAAMPLFGSRGTAGATNTSSFNLFYLSQFNTDHYDYWLRPDFGGAGSNTAFPIDWTGVPFDEKLIFNVEFGKKTIINGVEYTSPTDTVGSARPVFIGSINDGGTADTRASYVDFSDFVIYNASDVVVFHGIAVPQGSTEYSTTPAPSNCYWDLVSQTYKVQSGGTGVIWYEDTDDNLAEFDPSTAQTADYGLKVLAEGDMDVAYMNSKYPLFGSDISKNVSQFKTYEFTLTGYNSEPNPPFPAYVYDSNFYQGSGTIERTAQTIDTGFSGGTIKSILIQHSGVQAANFQARAREILFNSGTGENIDSYLNPSSKVVPGYINLNQSVLYMVNQATADIITLSGQFGSANFNTLGSFNGGTVNSMYFTPPQLKVALDADGILRIKTVVPYNWIQRAFIIGSTTYRARWKDWAWYQGVTVRVTVLNTPYVIE